MCPRGEACDLLARFLWPGASQKIFFPFFQVSVSKEFAKEPKSSSVYGFTDDEKCLIIRS
jgi:hypothetical protein